MNYLEVTGLVGLAYIFLVIFQWAILFIFRSFVGDVLKPHKGDYAIVTGATDGIGLQFARQLAQKGYKLLLLSRSDDKLRIVAQDIVHQFAACENVRHFDCIYFQIETHHSFAGRNIGG